MNQTVAKNIEEILFKIRYTRLNMREDLKKRIKEYIDNEDMDYAEAVITMKESQLFDIAPFVLSHTDNGSIFDIYDEHLEDKYSTVYFTDIICWIEDQEGEVQEACDAAGEDDPYKQLYDYAMEHDTIGYVFDW